MNKFVNDYDNIIMMGALNCDVDNKHENNKILNFCKSFSLTNIVKEQTCFKNPIKPTCIYLIITNRKKRFNDATVIETCLSDCHLMTVTYLNKYIKKLQPRITCYRSYKILDTNAFRRDLIENIIVLKEHEITYTNIKNTVMDVLNIPMQLKKKISVQITYHS